MQCNAQRQLEGQMARPKVHLQRIRTHHHGTRLFGRVAVPAEWMAGGISVWVEYEWYEQ